MMGRKRTVQKLLRLAVFAGVIAVAWGGAVLGWRWKENAKCERIEVLGAVHADRQRLLDLARIQVGMSLFDIDPVLTADRVRRHPWVKQAMVERVPTGTVRIRVTERVPVAEALSPTGAPAYFLDDTGVKLPIVEDAAYDVPLIRGIRTSEEKAPAVGNASVRALLASLAGLLPETNAVLSDFELQRSGDILLHTTPIDARGSMLVRLGKGDYTEKLKKLAAFWQQAVLPQPEKTFAWIDLRFNGQIVTQEEVSSPPSVESSHMRLARDDEPAPSAGH
ncbi:MAG TPA: FtsQ-type POTRA domain-containing protein [Rhodothermales bacterium]|nr:FtsQ-type POTRA domain-containing protein [Rhodothermales bacterium]